MQTRNTHTPQGSSWTRNPDGGATALGVTWFQGVTWMQMLAALAAVMMLLVAAAGPAAAGKPDKGGPKDDGGNGGMTYCADLPGSTTLHDVNVAIGADGFHKPKGNQAPIMGAGIDVAVIDTGVNAVGINEVVDGPDLSFDALEDNLRHRDLHGHGTNMAGIVATNTATEWGVAPDARIINVKVGAADGTVDVSQVIAGIDWVVENRDANGMNIRVLNLAYSTDADVDYRSDPLTRAVENAWHNGILVVAAGGNEGRSEHRLGNPALDPYVIAVGGAKQTLSQGGKSVIWNIPSWSSTGDDVRNPDLVAPGDSLVSLGVEGSYLADTYPEASCVGTDGQLRLRGSGTSQAAAVVSGAAAMILEQRPELTPDQVKYLFTSTADLLSDHMGPKPERQQGAGMLNLAAAMAAPTPGLEAIQTHAPALGGGSLDDSRGSFHVGTDGDYLDGETTAFGGDFDSMSHSLAQTAGATWSDQTWDGATWSGGTWSGATWSGATWSGATWSGATWSGATWSGATWSGATWSGATWSGATWSGATWSGATWSGATWSGATWS